MDLTQSEIDAQRENAELKRRLARLESEWERAKHHGLSDLLSVSGSMRFGGNAMMFGPFGIQMRVPTQLSGIYGVQEFVAVIDGTGPYPRVDLFLKNDGASPYIGIEALASGGGYTDVLTQITAATAVAQLRASFDGTGNDVILRAENTSAGRKSVGLSGDCVFFTGVYGSDPSFTLANGDEWFRSDTFKKRGRGMGGVTGATDNFAMEGWVTGTAAMGSGSTLTISVGGVVTVTDGYHLIDTNAGGATDDLDTISGSVAGKLYLLRAVNGARDVVVKNGTGNIFLAGSDFTLDNTNDTILLFSNGTNLYEVARANNGA